MKLITLLVLCLSLLVTSCNEENVNQYDCSSALSNWIVDMNISVTSFSCQQDDERCFCSINIGNRFIPVECYKNKCYFE